MLGNSNIDKCYSNELITSCGFTLWAMDATIPDGNDRLLKTENISSFSMSRSNECALSLAPNDKMIINIIDWKSLNDDRKNYLTNPTTRTNNKWVFAEFIVDNNATSYVICFAIQKCEIDEENNTAKLTLCSPLQIMCKNSVSGLVLRTYGFDSFPTKVTDFELAQNTAVNTGKGLKIVSQYNSYSYSRYTLVDMNDNTAVVGFSRKNITSKIKKYKDENDRSNIEFVGLKVGNPVLLYTESETPEWDYQLGDWKVVFNNFKFFDKQYVVTSIEVWETVQGSPDTDVTSRFQTFNSQGIAGASSIPSTHPTANRTYVLKVYGYEAELDTPTADNFVSSYVYLTGNAGLATAQTATRTYYSNLDYYEFDCRLDPRIEPLDNIYVDGVGVIKVEQLTMNYNGAFKGHIKGRKVGDLSPLSPVVSSGFTSTYYTFSFTLTNPNSVDVKAKIYNEATNTYIYIPISANSSVTVTHANYPSLLSAIQRARRGTLSNPIYAETIHSVCYNHKASDKTLIWLVSPTDVGWQIVDEERWYFKYKNNNDFDVTMKVNYSSSNTLTFTIPAKSTIMIDIDNASQIETSVSAYINEELTADVYCYYQYSGLTSANSIMLGANY